MMESSPIVATQKLKNDQIMHQALYFIFGVNFEKKSLAELIKPTVVVRQASKNSFVSNNGLAVKGGLIIC